MIDSGACFRRNTLRYCALHFILVVYFTSSLAHAGKLYSWVDENGQTQYSDHPPTGSRYTEKRLHSGARKNITASQHGLRQGEQELLRKSNSRKSDVLKSRRTASRKFAAGKERCSQLSERYRTLLGEPGEDNRRKAKDAYRQMTSACR
ncbi:MAG: DUF4124 domain-containing protein [Thiohalobacterales bacterium]